MPAEAPPSRNGSLPPPLPHASSVWPIQHGPHPGPWPPYAAAPPQAPLPSTTMTTTGPKDATMVHRDNSGAKPKKHGDQRRCYNCKTADTVTWRKSILAVGKIACNKCGLYERTHKRPRTTGFVRDYTQPESSTVAEVKKPATPPRPPAPQRASPSPLPEGAFSIRFSPLKPDDVGFTQGHD